jgi:hypothetical protein
MTREPDLAVCLTADRQRAGALPEVLWASPGVVDKHPGDVAVTGDEKRDGLPLDHDLPAGVPARVLRVVRVGPAVGRGWRQSCW